MSNTALTIRTDDKTKKTIVDFATSLGLSTSAFVMAVTLQAVRDKRVVLAPQPKLEPTPYLEDIMREAETDYAANKSIVHTKGAKGASEHLNNLRKS